MLNPKYWGGLALTLWLAVPATAQEQLTMETLKNADYVAGKNAFAMRCSACHTLADRGANLTGPNLWGVFDRQVGTLDAYENFSDALKAADFVWTPDTLNAWLADPRGFLEGNEMAIPEAVPENERAPIISFLMIETGADDWPVPENLPTPLPTRRSPPPSASPASGIT